MNNTSYYGTYLLANCLIMHITRRIVLTWADIDHTVKLDKLITAVVVRIEVNPPHVFLARTIVQLLLLAIGMHIHINNHDTFGDIDVGLDETPIHLLGHFLQFSK